MRKHGIIIITYRWTYFALHNVKICQYIYNTLRDHTGIRGYITEFRALYTEAHQGLSEARRTHGALD